MWPGDPTHLSQSKQQRISNEKGEEIAGEEYKSMDNSPLFWNMVKYRHVKISTSSEQIVTKENTSGSQLQNTGLFAKFWV